MADRGGKVVALHAVPPFAVGVGMRATATPSPELAPLLVMLDLIGAFGLVELERALTALLAEPATTPAEQRVSELSALTQLLESDLAVEYRYHRVAPVQVSQTSYELTRPAGAPTAEALINRYGGAESDGWAWACRAAWGLLPDGRKTKPGQAWTSARRGKRLGPRSDRDMVISSIRACAFALLRRPSSNVYIAWHGARRRRPRERAGGGAPRTHERLASIAAVYQHFASWERALLAADITDADLADARAKLLVGRDGASASDRAPSAHDVLAALTGDELDELGLTEQLRDRLVRKGCGGLPVSEASTLAHALGGSLDWLAGVSEEQRAPADITARFDPDALRREAKRAGVGLDALRHKAKLDVSGWRFIMARKREPTVAHLARWAGSLRTRCESLTS